jgi:hypothetical protein
MARYIKANPKVAKYLHLENDRNTVKDGNYLLWQADMLAFGRLTQLSEILTQIGGLALQAYEARQEQDGTVCRELPTATDPRFIIETAAAEEVAADTETAENSTESDGSSAETTPSGTESEENGTTESTTEE